MIFVRLSDGLGNQMFQYAYARYLQKQYKEVIYLNVESYQNSKERNFSLEHFNLNPNVYVMKGIAGKLMYRYMDSLYVRYRDQYKEKDFNHVKDEKIKIDLVRRKGLYIALPSSFEYYNFGKTACKNKIVIGFFQSPKYFPEMGNVLKSEFSIKETLSESVLELKKKIQRENSVCVHIRRGDYLKIRWRALNICDEKYYLEAMDLIANQVKNPVFYIFSNTQEDLRWIENNYNFKYPVKYMDMNNPDYVELDIMSACKHFIISNSTYSWWAQYLSKSKDKIVVAPSKWYKSNKYFDKDIYMNGWQIIDV